MIRKSSTGEKPRQRRRIPANNAIIAKLGRNRFVRVSVALLLFLALFLAITRAWRLNLYAPIVYWGDALEMASYFGRDFVFNDLRERFFAPFGAEHASALRYAVNLIFQPNSALFMGSYWITGDIIAALNVYYLATFPLIFLSAYWVYGRLKLLDPFRFWAAALYALMPFHFERGEGHLMESSYFIVPILAWVLIRVFAPKPFFHSFRDGRLRLTWADRPAWITVAVIVCFSSVNEYHHLFFVVLLCLAGLASARQHRNIRILVGVVVLVAAAAVPIVAKAFLERVMSAPELQLSLNGAPISGYGGEERFGLKIVQVILPVAGHPLEFLRTIRGTYDSSHEVNENATVALGIFGAIGFVYLITRGVWRIVSNNSRVRNIDVASFLSVCCVVIATVGGLASVIATVSMVFLGPAFPLTQARSYNRIIVFLAFFAYYAAAFLTERVVWRLTSRVRSTFRRNAIITGVWLPIFMFSLWDQVPFTINNSESDTTRYYSDKEFFARIERRVAPHARIFQYPFNLHHTEANRPGRYPYNYADGLRPYLNSQALRFTYGADNGSRQAAWLEDTAALSPPVLVQRLCEYRFSGILIHRKLFGTLDEARQFESDLVAVLGSPLEESRDKDFSFGSLERFCSTNGPAQADPGSLSEKMLTDRRRLVYEIDLTSMGYPNFLSAVSGMSGREPWGRWTNGPVATFYFGKPLAKNFILEITANAFGPNLGAPVRVKVGGVEKTFVIQHNTGDTYRLAFQTDGTASSLEIIPPSPTSPNEIDPNSGDTRKIGIGLLAIRIKE